MISITFLSFMEYFIKNIGWRDLPCVRPWLHTQNFQELDLNFYQRR